MKALIPSLGTYLLLGIGTALYTAYRGSNGQPHFAGFGTDTGPVLGLAETIFLWPVALVMNFTAK